MNQMRSKAESASGVVNETRMVNWIDDKNLNVFFLI
jgi:hypothetical protein